MVNFGRTQNDSNIMRYRPQLQRRFVMRWLMMGVVGMTVLSWYNLGAGWDFSDRPPFNRRFQ